MHPADIGDPILRRLRHGVPVLRVEVEDGDVCELPTTALAKLVLTFRSIILT